MLVESLELKRRLFYSYIYKTIIGSYILKYKMKDTKKALPLLTELFLFVAERGGFEPP